MSRTSKTTDKGGEHMAQQQGQIGNATMFDKIDPKALFTKTAVPCNKCESADERSKVLCVKCRRWWHHRKCVGKVYTEEDIRAGFCVCETCIESMEAEDVVILEDLGNDELSKHEKDKDESENQPIEGLTQRGDRTAKESTRVGQRPRSKTSSGRNTAAILKALQDEEALELEEMELKLKMVEIKKSFARKRREALEGSEHSSISSKDVTRKVDTERKNSIDKCKEWRVDFASQPNPATIEKLRARRPATYSKANMTVADFLDATVGEQVDDEERELSSSQLRARKVMSIDLPTFSGNPLEWPKFIDAFAESTRKCGFSDRENMSRLGKCLRGAALDAVQTDLLTPNSLPNALNTLRILYGRPEVVFNALVEQARRAPRVNIEKLETLVIFAMKIKALCDTAKASGMTRDLENSALLAEFVDKLPAVLQLAWGDRCRWEEYDGRRIGLTTFDQWLRDTTESASHLKPKYTGTTPRTQPNSNMKKNVFQGAHQELKPATEECVVCQEAVHKLENCSSFKNLSVPGRWAVVRERRLCVSCLGNHFIAQCQRKKHCSIDGCDHPHNTLLHSTNAKRNGREEPTKCDHCEHCKTQKKRPKENHVHSEAVMLSDDEGRHVNVHTQQAGIYFQVVPVVLSDENGRRVKTFAFLDNGSEVTMIEEELIRELRVTGPKSKLRLKWTGDVGRTEEGSRIVQLSISDRDSISTYPLSNVRTVKSLNLPIQSVERKDLTQFDYLKDVPLPEYGAIRPRLLIGLNNSPLLTAQETVERNWDEPVAVRTKLGWTVIGKTGALGNSEYHSQTHIQDDKLENLVKQYFTFENLGVVVPTEEVESSSDRRARKLMKDQIRYCTDGHYEVGLLWENKNEPLPASYNMAMRRHICLEKRLHKDQDMRAEMNKQMHGYIEQGFLEEVPEDQKLTTEGRIWYLPIFAVTNPNKPGKIRVVWDAAAAVNGRSLNSFLLTGPDLLTNLVGILYKFRERRYAVGADIRQMFHQIKIQKSDQDAQRCLWRFDQNEIVKTYRMKVMTFGASCSPSLAQFVKNFHADKYKTQYPRAVEAIQRRHYVDDYVDSFNTIQECIDVAQQVVRVHDEGGFHIRGFVSNSPEILRHLPHDENEVQKCIFEPVEVSAKILGMWWDTESDALTYRVNNGRISQILTNRNETPTKREVLRTVMSVFDPLGLLGYFIIQGKLIMKAIWRSNIEWDEAIRPEERNKWESWINQLKHISSVRIPRWYFEEDENDNVELHLFVDASEDAVAAVAYFVRVGQVYRESRLIASKTKIAPNKPISIPRLELQAAVLGARLATTIIHEHSLKMVKTYYWTDSRNVLCWLRSPRRFKTFVAHRIGEIRETTNVKDWRWVPTNNNIADVATKWRVLKSTPPVNWLEGPDFIREPSKNWPEEPPHIPEVDESDLEFRCYTISTDVIDKLRPDLTRFSKFKRLVNTQVYVLRFFYRRKLRKSITPDEIIEAENYLIRSIQLEEFQKEFEALRGNKTLAKDSKLRSYSPFIDKCGLLRMRSRLSNAEYLTFQQRCPVILPKRHRLTDLIVEQEHQKFNHQNHSTVLNELRQKYAIPALRSRLKTIRGSCRRCRIYQAQPNVPEMATLPHSRLAVRMRPFTFTGVDLFGPMYVKHGRKVEKKWGVLFTCLTTRAIHLELTAALSTDAFMLSFQCFVGRRGLPREVYSDNGTNFTGANNELQKIQKHILSRDLQDKFNNIKWSFNPPGTPHMGGAWERLVRSVKSGLRCLVDERPPTEDALRATLIEIEAMVNSRPLTYVDTSEGALESLTPNHFLLGASSGLKPWGNFTDDPATLRHEWKRQQVVSEQFWRRWTNEYLPEIARRTKWFDKVDPLRIGDVVAVVDSQSPYSWQLGRIVETTTSKDGGVRQVLVKTSQGLIKRPTSKLAILLREDEKLRGNTTSSVGGSVAE